MNKIFNGWLVEVIAYMLPVNYMRMSRLDYNSCSYVREIMMFRGFHGALHAVSNQAIHKCLRCDAHVYTKSLPYFQLPFGN